MPVGTDILPAAPAGLPCSPAASRRRSADEPEAGHGDTQAGTTRTHVVGADLRGGFARSASIRTRRTPPSSRHSMPGSTTSTPQPATATPNCGSARTWPRCVTGSSSPPRRATGPKRRPGRRSTASLERLQTDHVDLIQMHARLRPPRPRSGDRRQGVAEGGDPRQGRGSRARDRHHRPHPRGARRAHRRVFGGSTSTRC